MRTHSSVRKLRFSCLDGFTLLEMLVSMTLLVILVVMLMSMVDGATKMWRTSENRVDSYREARAALNVMAADLSSLAISQDTNFFKFDPTNNTLSFITSVSPSYQDGGGTNSISTKNKSNLCEVTYTWKYERPNPLNPNGPESYNLFRTFKSSTDTYSDIQATNLFKDGTKEALARNIAKIKFQAFTTDTSTNGTTSLIPFSQSTQTPMPDLVIVSVDALNNESVKRFTSAGDWSNTNSVNYKQNHRLFTTEIKLQTKDSRPTPTPSPTPSSP